MINIYSQNNTNYTKNGDATLIPISCELSLTINGAWELTLEHPYDEEERYKYIVEGAVIQADVNCINELSATKQRFRIYDYKKGLNSVTAVAYPIAMESTHDAPIANLVISNKTGVQAMALLQTYTNKYTLSTDITKTASTSYENTNVNAAIANGDDSCFIKKFGGEICYDNLNFMVKSRLGDTTPEDHPVAYGHNLTDIEYEKDDSGLITRIYPISKDGIRLNGNGYVDSPKINNYPIPHCRYMQVPNTLVNTDVSSPSAEAALTNQAKTAISSSATSTSQTGYANAINAGYEPEYVAKNYDSIREAVLNMALANIYDASMYSAFESAITSSISWLSKLTQPEWTWMEVQSDGWRYGNANGYAKSRYVYVDKKWRYFGSDGYWQRPRDDGDDWDWYQPTGSSGRKYGNYNKYYAHNEYVYITISGQMKEYWFDKSGWYDDDKSGDSNYAWHGSGTSADPWWFGDDSSTGKYLKDCWRFIDGTYYYFDSNGYYDGSTKKDNYQWDWNDGGSADQTWFGNALNRAYAATYLTSQWCKIDGDWYYFDSNGYAVAQATSRSNLVAVFTTAMSGLTSLCNTWKTSLYNLLYSQMTAYCNAQFNTGIDVPVVTITVNMVDLSNTTEYEGYAHLETVKLGDSVKCVDAEHNISAIERVVGIKYNCITQENIEVTIGVAGSSMMSILNVNAGGSSVAGGFDTSIIESTLTSHGNSIASLQANKQNKLTAGHGIEIENDVISATGSGQGLLYWEETSEDFTREINEELPDNFTCDAEYLKTDVSYEIQDSSGGVVRPFLKYTGRAICAKFTYWGYISGTSVYRQFWGTAYISTNPDYVKYSTNGGNSWYTYSGTTNINGVTFYISSGQNSVAIQEGYSRVDNTELVDIGDFEDYGSAVEYLINHANIRAGTDVVNETGIGVGNKIIWGGTRYSATEDYPFEVDDDGTVVINKTIFGMGADAHIYYSALWTNYVAGLYNGYEYRKINNEKAIIGAFGYALNIRFILVSTYSNAVKWNWRDRGSIGAWSDMSSYQGEANLGVSFTYKNATWYATCIKGLAGDSSPTSYAGIDYIDGSIGNVSNDNVIALAKHFIDVTNATKYVDRTVKLGTGDRIFEYTDDDRLLAYINDDGSSSFDYQLDINPSGSPTNKLSKVGYEGDIYSAKEIGTGTSNPSGGFRDDVYYKYEYTTQMVDDEITLPTFTDDVSTQVAISNFSKYVNAKFVYTDQGGGVNEKTVTIASLPETTNPSWNQGGDIYVFNAYLYIVCGRDSSGLWIKECGNSLQELYCEYESNEYTVLAHYVKLGDTWVQVSTGGSTQIQSDWDQTDSSAVDFIKNKPNLATVATSGSYNDLSNKPTIPDAQVQADWDESDSTKVDYIKNKPTLATVATSGDYDDLLDKPNLSTVATSGSYNDLSNKPTIPDAQVQSNWTESDNTKVDFIKNKPNLATVATSGSYNDLSNKPNLSTVATSGSYNDLSNKPTIPSVEANPSGSGSTDLTKLEVDGTVYNIPSGSGQTLPLVVQNGKLCIVYET